MGDEQNDEQPSGPNVVIRPEEFPGVWANYAQVTHTVYEFTLDFARLDFGQHLRPEWSYLAFLFLRS